MPPCLVDWHVYPGMAIQMHSRYRTYVCVGCVFVTDTHTLIKSKLDSEMVADALLVCKARGDPK